MDVMEALDRVNAIFTAEGIGLTADEMEKRYSDLRDALSNFLAKESQYG